jgi:uncharacterized protein (TIGR03083 family)
MKNDEVWRHIHGERREMVETLSSLSPEQWATPSLCEGWSVQVTTGHLLSAAEQTPMGFYRELVSAGLRFNVFTDRSSRRLAAIGPDELVRRLGARVTTTNRPPAPVLAMLGEIVVHGEDIRRPLDLKHETPEAAMVALADGWKRSNLLIGAKRRIAGLRLRASDVEWEHGDGPEVTGPMISLLLAMSGRQQALGDLQGEGLSTLAGRT